MSATSTSARGATPVVPVHGHAGRWAAAVAASGLGILVLLVAWNVWTPWGQRLDQRALDSLVVTEAFRDLHLTTVLLPVGVRTIAAVLAVCVLLALVRRRADLAAAALVVVVGTNATTYLLRVYLVHRPDFGVGELGMLNSAPSGRTAAALSVAVALVLVAPMSLRFWVTFGASLWSAWVALGLLVVHMQRPSDVLSALAVGAVWAGVGIAVAAVLSGRPRLKRALRAWRGQTRGLGWQRVRETQVANAPYGLTLLILSGLSAVMVMAVLLVAWGVGVQASALGIVLGLGSLTLAGASTGILVGATSRAVEKYLR